MENQQSNQLQIKADDESLKGRYANLVQLGYNNEEFIIDFFLAVPPVGQLISRIVMSPSHMKRLSTLLTTNIKEYEEKTGKKLEAAEEPKHMGFKA
jgi:hypothetical protein